MLLRVLSRALVWGLAAFVFAPPACSATDRDVSAAVVRVEVAIDPVSAGPGIAAELVSRQPWTPYEAEVARRLRIGSAGTGFFVNADGYLVTNAHVVLSGVRYRGLHLTQAEWDSMARLLDCIRDVWVTTGEGEEERSYLAVAVAVDEDLDLAVLRVVRPPGDGTLFPFLPIADSDNVKVGDPVRALGYAGESAIPDSSTSALQDTSGQVLSLITGHQVHEPMNIVRRSDPATGREIVTVSGTAPGPVLRLHHNAPVGHGSSGGPILDSEEGVIGVAYALIAERPSNGADSSLAEDPALAGLNLAITSNVLRSLLASQSVSFTQAPAAQSSPQGGERPRGGGTRLGGTASAGSVSCTRLTLAPATHTQTSRLAFVSLGTRAPSLRPEQMEAELARKPYNYLARQLLVDQLRQEGDYRAAYWHAAWLTWLASRHYSDSEDGAAFLLDRGNRDRARSSGGRFLVAATSAVNAQRLLYGSCLNGSIAQQSERVRKEIADMLAEAEESEAATGRNDPVAKMALVQMGLSLDDAVALDTTGGEQASRPSVLRIAAVRAETVAAWYPDAPGPHRALATIRARKAELDNRAELWDAAIDEANRAFQLDPDDPDLPELLWTLHLRAGHWAQAAVWRRKAEAAIHLSSP